jgi:hypothetical protein
MLNKSAPSLNTQMQEPYLLKLTIFTWLGK